MRPANHGLDREAAEPRCRPERADPRQHLLDRHAHRVVVAQAEDDAAHIRLVADVRRQDLQGHGITGAPCRLDCGARGGVDRHRGHHRNAVRLQDRLRFQLIEHLPAGADG
jgi:hypothetical protein